MPKKKKKIVFTEIVSEKYFPPDFSSKQKQNIKKLINNIKENGNNYDDLSDLVEAYKRKYITLDDTIDIFKDDITILKLNDTPFSMNLKYVDILSINNTTSNKIYNKLIKEYNIDDKKHYKLNFNWNEISEIIRLLLRAMYSIKYKKLNSYSQTLNKLEENVEEYKKSKENGEYDVLIFRPFFGDQEGERISFKFGSTQFIFACELLLSYLKEFEKNSESKNKVIEDTYLSVIGTDKYVFSGTQKELSSLFMRIYEKKEVSDKYAPKAFIHECLIFISYCKKVNSQIYYSNDKNSLEYKNSVNTISKEIHKAKFIPNDYFDTTFENTKKKFIEILKEKEII